MRPLAALAGRRVGHLPGNRLEATGRQTETRFPDMPRPDLDDIPAATLPTVLEAWPVVPAISSLRAQIRQSAAQVDHTDRYAPHASDVTVY